MVIYFTFVLLTTTQHNQLLISLFISVLGFCLVCWKSTCLYTPLSAPLRICVSGGECGETLLRSWKRGCGLNKRRGKKRGLFTGVGCGEGHPHLVAKEWLIRWAGINERFVCPHVGLAVMSLASLEFCRFHLRFPLQFLTASDSIMTTG